MDDVFDRMSAKVDNTATKVDYMAGRFDAFEKKLDAFFAANDKKSEAQDIRLHKMENWESNVEGRIWGISFAVPTALIWLGKYFGIIH